VLLTLRLLQRSIVLSKLRWYKKRKSIFDRNTITTNNHLVVREPHLALIFLNPKVYPRETEEIEKPIQAKGMVMTLKLRAGAEKVKLCAVEIVLVCGVTRFGFVGVLLSEALPWSWTSVPDEWTAEGSLKTTDAAEVSVLDTFQEYLSERKNTLNKERHTLMMNEAGLFFFTTDQKSVPFAFAFVLGR
jgi:hypothetical protein